MQFEFLVVIKMSYYVEAMDKEDAVLTVKDLVFQETTLEIDDSEIVEIHNLDTGEQICPM
jgi:hypothetical protein